MGVCETVEERKESYRVQKQNTRVPELSLDHKPIPLEILLKALKSICKITLKTEKEIIYGTGFFMNFHDSKKYLITNYHIIYKEMINNDIIIEIYNNKTMKLNMNNREVKYYERPIDITIIEIKNNDNIFDDVEFFIYNNDNFGKDYIMYKNIDVFSIEYSLGKNPECARGKIININNYEFEDNLPSNNYSSGRPIILLNNNSNLIQVIGIHKEIHKEINKSNNVNCCTFIGEIFRKNYLTNNNNYTNNYIIAEININDKEVQKDIRIISSYEEYCRVYNIKELKKEEMNEDKIKKCEIKINDKVESFNYFYKFSTKGKYIIKYTFTDYITNTNHMFSNCESLTNINLSNFNTQNVNNMSYMFWNCRSLTNINLSNFQTKNVINMSWMFWGCHSLENINLSLFNTQNVIDISHIFSYCESLTNIDLSNFDTQNVTNMSYMFSNCKSLTNINLSNFNTQKVTNMSAMFFCCDSLKNINLSNFNTKNVTNMSGMFFYCKSLTNINLSNFNFKNVINRNDMFLGCESLRGKIF